MAAIKMEALRTFAGAEGFVRKGDLFVVSTERRAMELIDRKLAKRAEVESPPEEEPEQVVPPPNDKAEVRLIEPVTELEIVRPPFHDAVKHVGGGWYELPNGERISGKEAALAVYERGDCDG